MTAHEINNCTKNYFMKGTKICLSGRVLTVTCLKSQIVKLTLQRYDHSKTTEKFNITESTFRVESD